MLTDTRPELATVAADLATAIAAEPDMSPRLTNSLADLAEALLGGEGKAVKTRTPAGRRARREPGPWDPFTVYAEHGEQGLRDQLGTLELEQLRNIVAEHGMDTDRLAMKWRDPERVIGRIVDRVVDRAAKGEGFRNPVVRSDEQHGSAH
jgi:hypothetical protein